MGTSDAGGSCIVLVQGDYRACLNVTIQVLANDLGAAASVVISTRIKIKVSLIVIFHMRGAWLLDLLHDRVHVLDAGLHRLP